MDSKGQLRDAWGRFLKNWKDIEGYEDENAYQSNIKQSDRQIGRPELQRLLQDNICEIVFVRRRPERYPHRPLIRRMLCTNSMRVLNTQRGIGELKYHPPKTSRRLDQVKHNIVVVWDIILQDYRNVSMEQCYLRQTIPADDTFWKYYDKVVSQMSFDQKMNFMDSIS
jgi:hypothetical protein